MGEYVHTLVLGSGPGNLTAAYTLCAAGANVVVVEKESQVGGLMRSIRHGRFIVDIGRKELYSRIPQVQRTWSELLGGDLRPYHHRVGILYKKYIMDQSRHFTGPRCGMPWHLLLACAADYIWGCARAHHKAPENYEEYCYNTRGRMFSRVLYQEYEENFEGQKWAELAPPHRMPANTGRSVPKAVMDKLKRAFRPETHPRIWQHPAKGTGQICETLKRRIMENGGRFYLGAKVVGIEAPNSQIETATVETGSTRTTFRPSHVVSGLPLDLLLKALLKDERVTRKEAVTHLTNRGTVLTYLFLNEPPRFPHAWLEVTSPNTVFRRITNYSAFNGEMVPPGTTCLCMESFCAGHDPLLALDDNQLRRIAIEECVRARLIDAKKVFDCMILKLPRANAATHPKDWINANTGVLSTLEQYKNLYLVNRAGLDVSSFAGLEAAKAILSGNRNHFLKRCDPTRCDW